MTYKEATLIYSNTPKDTHTVLKNGSIGHWFYVYTESGIIYARPAKNHKPSCSMQQPIKLYEEHFEDMLKLYNRRLAGDEVSQEAQKISRAQVYWYGIFNDLGL